MPDRSAAVSAGVCHPNGIVKDRRDESLHTHRCLPRRVESTRSYSAGQSASPRVCGRASNGLSAARSSVTEATRCHSVPQYVARRVSSAPRVSTLKGLSRRLALSSRTRADRVGRTALRSSPESRGGCPFERACSQPHGRSSLSRLADGGLGCDAWRVGTSHAGPSSQSRRADTTLPHSAVSPPPAAPLAVARGHNGDPSEPPRAIRTPRASARP